MKMRVTAFAFAFATILEIMLFPIETSNGVYNTTPIPNTTNTLTESRSSANLTHSLLRSNPLLKLSEQDQTEVDEQGVEVFDSYSQTGFDTEPTSQESSFISVTLDVSMKPLFGAVIDQQQNQSFMTVYQDSNNVIKSLNPQKDCSVLNLSISWFLDDVDPDEQETELFDNIYGATWLQAIQTEAFTTLMELFDSITQAMSCQMKYLNFLNKQIIDCFAINNDHTSASTSTTSRSCQYFDFQINDMATPTHGLKFFLEQINAWKRLHLFVFSKEMHENFQTIKYGFLLQLQDDYNDELLLVQLQFDCISYIFRRFLHELAMKWKLYHSNIGLIDLTSNCYNIFNTSIFNRIYSKELYIIDYFACEDYHDRLNTFGLWIQTAFGKSKFYDGVWMSHAIENPKYENIFQIDANSIGEWIVYTMKLDSASKNRKLKRSKLSDILCNPTVNCGTNMRSPLFSNMSSDSSYVSTGQNSSSDGASSTTPLPKPVKKKTVDCCMCM